MVVDDDGWSLIAFWLIGSLVGLETVIVTDGSDSITCTDSETIVSTTGSGKSLLWRTCCLGLCDVSGSLFRGGLFGWFRLLLLLVNYISLFRN